MPDELISLHDLLLRYAIALRTHRLENAAIIERMTGIGLTDDEAKLLIAEMDALNWRADSNGRTTVVGYLSILAAIAGTISFCYMVATTIGMDKVRLPALMVIPAVAFGLVAFGLFYALFAMVGLRTWVSWPLPIPDESILQRLVQLAREHRETGDTPSG